MSARGLALAALLAPVGPTSAQETAVPVATLSVQFDGLRSARGMVRACLTRDPALYLKCERDPAALRGNVAAGPGAHLVFADVPAGDYVLAVLHDENGNGKVDTLLGIPREGVGFSRNPAMRFGPPKWTAARIQVTQGETALRVKLKYFL